MTDAEWLERRALKVLQSDDTPLYLFTLAAEEVDLVADVARIGRDEAGKLIGYQRPEKQKHVKQIQEYLDSEDPLFPNGLILALPPEVRFKSSRGPGDERWTRCLRDARDPYRERRPMAPGQRGSSTASSGASRCPAPRTAEFLCRSPALSRRLSNCNASSSSGSTPSSRCPPAW